MGMGPASGSREPGSMTARRSVVRIKVTLKDVEPVVMRRLEVPLKIRLDRLHLVLQAAMGWTNTHLYAFTAGDMSWGLPDPDFGGDDLPADASTLRDILDDTGARTIHYYYDFGDGWDHVIKIERILDAVPMAPYPALLAAEGRCPPEDVGGPPGYQDFLAILAEPDHEEHDQTLTWCGGTFDPYKPDIDRILDEIDKLARRWAPRPRRATAKRAPQ